MRLSNDRHLSKDYKPTEGVAFSGYSAENHGAGIVHIGVGAFHRAHQAVYTDDVLALHGGDWRIIGINLQSTTSADTLNAQDGRYTLLTRSTDDSSTKLRIIYRIEKVEAAVREIAASLDALAAKTTKIVTITVTEKAYAIDRVTQEVDTTNDVIAHDLQHPDSPKGVIGIIVKGLSLRKSKGLKPYTVLCCDNLPQNGTLLFQGVIDFARRIDKPLATWIAKNGAFPNTMVDRITPATTDKLRAEVASVLGAKDDACVEAEEYSQWIIEDTFSCGRPLWEDVGVIFVKEVAPYEKMKLRMLNGAHSLIAYLGFLNQCVYVRDAMADNRIYKLVDTHINHAALTLSDLDTIDLKQYRQQLLNRFANVNIAHQTYQIAMDGSQKLPQRIFEPALESLLAGRTIDTYAFTTALWIRYCVGVDSRGETYDIRDPRQAELFIAIGTAPYDATLICKMIFALPGLMPDKLAQSKEWMSKTVDYLEPMLRDDMESALMLNNGC